MCGGKLGLMLVFIEVQVLPIVGPVTAKRSSKHSSLRQVLRPSALLECRDMFVRHFSSFSWLIWIE